MSERSKPHPSEATAPASPEAAAVRQFLAENPDFLLRNPGLLDHLGLPNRFGGKVVDLQHAMLKRAKSQSEMLSRDRDQLLARARAERVNFQRFQNAVLVLLSARRFEHLVHLVTHDLIEPLAIDACSLCVEANGDLGPSGRGVGREAIGREAMGREAMGRVGASGVFVLEPGRIDQIFAGENVILRHERPRNGDVFGPAADLISSYALIRLAISQHAPAGMLALGARDPARFEDGQTIEWLGFLGRVLDVEIRSWLDLPS